MKFHARAGVWWNNTPVLFINQKFTFLMQQQQQQRQRHTAKGQRLQEPVVVVVVTPYNSPPFSSSLRLLVSSLFFLFFPRCAPRVFFPPRAQVLPAYNAHGNLFNLASLWTSRDVSPRGVSKRFSLVRWHSHPGWQFILNWFFFYLT